MRRALLAFLLVSSCAERQQLPPGTELETAEPAPGPAAVEDAGVSEMPTTSDKELATAWEPAKPAPKPAPAPAGEAAPAAAPDEETVEKQLSAQAEAESRAKLKDLLVGGKRALSRKEFDDAKTIAQGAIEVAADLSPTEQTQAIELSYKVAVAVADVAGAVRQAERWLKSCGPDKVDACRAKAIAALKGVGKIKGASAATLNEKLKAVKDADTCVTQGEAKRQAAPCLDQALGFYKRQKDKLMVARVAWVKASAALADPKKSGDVDALLKKVDAECTEARCASLRRKALKTAASLALAAGDAEGAATASLKEMRLGALVLPADRRPYARSPEVDKYCAAYDAKAGAGACRKLEKKLNGEWVFRDFSAGKGAKEFPADKVKSVNEHFNCLLQECLTLEAERLTPPEQVVYDVHWSVTNDGRVGEVGLGRKDQEAGPMLACLKRQFLVWRYPKYVGELQHVEQRFTVSAHERRLR